MKYYKNVFKNYFNFSGRSSRSEYWLFQLFNFIFLFIFGLIGIKIVIVLYYLVIIIPSFSVAIRRVHDCNKSGWFVLVPIYNLILMFIPGSIESNKYGENPKIVELKS